MSERVMADATGPLSHDALASNLAQHLRAREHRITWENLALDVDGLWQRPDVFSIRKTMNVRRCQPWVHEIKATRADFFSDIRCGKWRGYLKFCCRFIFACPAGLVAAHECPEPAGLIERRLGAWELAKPPKYINGWQLTERELMKLILGRWGTEPEVRQAQPPSSGKEKQ